MNNLLLMRQACGTGKSTKVVGTEPMACVQGVIRDETRESR